MTDRRSLAVLGSPILHSKSPQLHRAAYQALGLPWEYERIEMTGERLPGFLASLGPEWRGLSLTMPVKHDVMPLLTERHDVVRLTGVCNTVLLDEGHLRGFNTDVHGIVAAFSDADVAHLDHVVVLGGGATASSAIVAASLLGARRVTVAVRTPQRAMQLMDLGPLLGFRVDIEQLGDPIQVDPDAVISTLPNGTELDARTIASMAGSSVLFDVAYEPWPSTLAGSWHAVGAPVISGLEMLLNQAVMQIRVFTSGDPDAPLPDEPSVIMAMRESVSLASA